MERGKRKFIVTAREICFAIDASAPRARHVSFDFQFISSLHHIRNSQFTIVLLFIVHHSIPSSCITCGMACFLLPRPQPWFRHRPSKTVTLPPEPSQIASDSAIKLFYGLLVNGVYYVPARSNYEDGFALDNESSVRPVVF